MPDYLATPGSSFTRDQTGIRRIENVFIIPGPAQADGAEPYDVLDSWSPNVKPLGLVEIDRKAAKQPDGDWELRIGFAGAPDDNAFGVVLEIDHASVDSPLETLETWSEFAKKWGARFDGEKFDGFNRKIKDPATGEQIANPVYGQTHFLETNPVLRVTFGSRKFYPGLFLNCSKIQVPAVPRKFNEIVKSPDRRTWLKRTVKGRYFGNAWQFSLEYLLGFWNPDIYGAKVDDNLRNAVDGSSTAAGANVGNIA